MLNLSTSFDLNFFESEWRSMAKKEPINPFYFLLLLVSFTFVVTALAYAVVPVIEQKAMEASGEKPPPSQFRDELRENGWKWLLYQVVAMVILGFLSMGLDRLRRLQSERDEAKIPTPNDEPDSTAQGS